MTSDLSVFFHTEIRVRSASTRCACGDVCRGRPQATGSRVGQLAGAAFSVVFGTALSLWLSWRVSLAVAAFVPLGLLCAVLEHQGSESSRELARGEQQRANEVRLTGQCGASVAALTSTGCRVSPACDSRVTAACLLWCSFLASSCFTHC